MFGPVYICTEGSSAKQRLQLTAAAIIRFVSLNPQAEFCMCD